VEEQKKLRVELDKGVIGLTLAEDVLKEKEMKLLAKGMVITERLFDSLKRHEIKHVYVYEKTEEE
jgi:hypothetical protein